MKIYLAGEAPYEVDEYIREHGGGACGRLLSYYYLQNERESYLDDFIENGSGRYIDEEADKVKQMSTRGFFQYVIDVQGEGDGE